MERELSEMQKRVDCEASSVWLLEGDKLFPYIFFGEYTEGLADVELNLDEGIVGYCVSHNLEIISNNLIGDERWHSLVDKKTGFKTRNIICLPISMYGDVYGCIEMLNKIGGDFDENDLKVCREMIELIKEEL